MEHGNSVGLCTQQALPSFEHIIAFPQQHVDEPWAEYVGRVQLWSRDRLTKSEASGAYRALPTMAGIPYEHLNLFTMLAWHSYSEGLGQYAPVRLSERAIAALAGDTSSRAKNRASAALKALVAAGAVEVLEEARGPKPRLIRVTGIKRPTTKRQTSITKGSSPPPQVNRENRERKSAALRSAGVSGQSGDPGPRETRNVRSRSQDVRELVEAVLDRFAEDASTRAVEALIAEHGAEVVERQLEWFGYRDVEKFRRGPWVAFKCFCRDDDPEPEGLVNARRAREESDRFHAEMGRAIRGEEDPEDHSDPRIAKALKRAKVSMGASTYAARMRLAQKALEAEGRSYTRDAVSVKMLRDARAAGVL